MNKLRLAVLCLGVAAISATLVSAQDDEKKAAPKKAAAAGVLQPQMEPTGGWETNGKIGEKTEASWSPTTIEAGVDKKPVAGKPTTVVGEIIDLSCYLQLGKHGDKHKSCGQKCITNNQPIGLLTKTGAIYMLMEEEHDPRRDGQTTAFRKAANENFAKVMEVTGTESMVRGVHALYVTGYVNK